MNESIEIDLSQRNTKPNLLNQLFPFLFPSFLSILSISTVKNLLAKYKIWHPIKLYSLVLPHNFV